MLLAVAWKRHVRAVCELLTVGCGDLLAALYKSVGFFKLSDGVGGIYGVKIVFLTDAIDVVGKGHIAVFVKGVSHDAAVS